MTHQIPEPTRKALREFAFVIGGAVALIFGLLLPWLRDAGYPLWPWIFAAVAAAWGLAAPMTLRVPFTLWMKFGLLLNKIVSPIILGILFYLVFTPTALFMRLIGRDTMARSMSEETTTYRVPSHKPTRESMERPY